MRFNLWQAASLLTSVVLFASACVSAGAEAPGANDATSSINLEALTRLKDIDLEANPSVKAVVLKVLEQMRGKPEFVEIVRDFKITGQDPALLEIAAKDPNSQAGVEAMRLVLQDNQPVRLKEALAGTNALGVVQALGNTQEKAIVPLLQTLV